MRLVRGGGNGIVIPGLSGPGNQRSGMSEALPNRIRRRLLPALCRPHPGTSALTWHWPYLLFQTVGAVLWACAPDSRPRNRAIIAPQNSSLLNVLCSLYSRLSPYRLPQRGAVRDREKRTAPADTSRASVVGEGQAVWWWEWSCLATDSQSSRVPPAATTRPRWSRTGPARGSTTRPDHPASPSRSSHSSRPRCPATS